ncbi:MAG: DNA polymerase III subunit alpha [Halothermotrichaceae bacterium]
MDMNSKKTNNSSGFVHLHNHTEYSLLDGAVRVDELLEYAKKNNMSAVAMTDHGVLYGMIDFYRKAKKVGVKPIIGCEVYLAPSSRFEKKTPERYHLVLLAMNNQGIHNLINIVSKGWLEGFYYKPRVDKELLSQNSQGLVALSACIQGEIPQLILKGKENKIKQTISDYQSIFGRDNFYLELQDHNLGEEKKVNSKLIQLGNKFKAPLVVTNDVHYLKEKDARLHDLLLALQTGKNLDDEDRMSFPNNEFYFKSAKEMKKIFPAIEEAYANTLKIADNSEVSFDFNTFHLPEFPGVRENKNREELLKEKCERGLREKGLANDTRARDRLKYELEIIKEMGYVSYFLIVWDFVDYAEKNGIRVGPGRGSAAGSLVSYLLGITKINPLEYDLIFERFLNPERVTMPDIDIDFDENRDKIIEYVKDRYGKEKVAQIGTFGTMAARGAIRDVGRVMNVPLRKVDRIAKMVPGRPGTSIEDAVKMSKKLKNIYQEDSEVKQLLDFARGVEGLPRHISTHAAGVIIGAEPLDNIIPLQTQDESIITQLPMDNLEQLGLLKMDFLGLRNLTIINKALALIAENHSEKIDIDKIPLDDEKVYRLLAEGKTLGVFQMESHLFQDLNKKLKPDRFSDLIAILALGRPGPLGSGLVDQYIDSRHGIREPEYLHPSLEPILKETFGLILYQEQVMKIANDLAGYSMGEADLLRRGMGKKKKKLIASERSKFVKGAAERGIDSKTAHKIFDQMEYFAGYGFNKSHSAAYAMLAYQTAYLKANYPYEFMAALLSSVMSNLDKVASYIRECREMNIEVLPPDINKSGYEFKPDNNGNIHFGLKAIKNVGKGAIQAIIEGRKEEKYRSLKDFMDRVDISKINIQVIESLIKAGAFSNFKQKRSQMLVKYEDIYEKANARRRYHTAGQTSFFDIVDKKEEFYQDKIQYPDIGELNLDQKLNQEKEYLGIYLSAHPLDIVKDKIKHFTDYSQDYTECNKYTLAGMIINKKEHITKNNSQMAFLTIEDFLQKMNIVVFPDIYQKTKNYLNTGEKVLIKGRVDGDSILAEVILPLDRTYLELKISSNNKGIYREITKCLNTHQGDIPVFINIKEGDNSYIILTGSKYWINSSKGLEEKLSRIIGKENITYYK